MSGKHWLVVGAIVAGLAVGLGAFGAHSFKDHAAKLYADEALRARRLDNWETAVSYQMYHALALLAVGFAAIHYPSWRWQIAGGAFVVGVMLFSGSLYGIALSGVADWKTASKAWIALIVATPLGGLAFIVGWCGFLAGALGMNLSKP